MFIDEGSGPGSVLWLCPAHAAVVIAEDPIRRTQALDALSALGETMVNWPTDADPVTVSAEVIPDELLLRVESDHGESYPPLMQAVTVAPGERGGLWFWFVWAADCHSIAPGPVLHPIASIDHTEAAKTKLSVMLALL